MKNKLFAIIQLLFAKFCQFCVIGFLVTLTRKGVPFVFEVFSLPAAECVEAYPEFLD